MGVPGRVSQLGTTAVGMDNWRPARAIILLSKIPAPYHNALKLQRLRDNASCSVRLACSLIGRFLSAPRWHMACNPRCNGRKRDSTQAVPSDAHPVSLASRVVLRRVTPGLWRSRRIRPATAPSHFRTRHASERDGAARSDANVCGCCCQHDRHRRDLERERNTGRLRCRGND
jgi:hypothetical protein